MIHEEMDLRDALIRQMDYCSQLPNYRCGVYIKRLVNKQLVADEMIKMVEHEPLVEKIINHTYHTEVRFKNGSFIKVIHATETARGHKNHGVIIDSEIEYEVYRNIIMPSLITRRTGEFDCESWEEVKRRIFDCDMNK